MLFPLHDGITISSKKKEQKGDANHKFPCTNSKPQLATAKKKKEKKIDRINSPLGLPSVGKLREEATLP